MTLNVHTGGRKDGEDVVVFLHGAGADHTVWRFQTRWLAHRGWKIRAPDLPGHGASDGPSPDSIAEAAEWLGGFLAELGRAAVVGHSMGALIALETASGDPACIERMMLVGAGPRIPVHPTLLAAARDDRPLAAAYIAGWSVPAANRGGHPYPGTWHQGGISRLVERSRPGVLAADLTACASYEASELEHVAVPVWVVAGDQDRMIPKGGPQQLAEAIPGARLVTLPGAGHEPMLQQPREFNRVLARFLAEGRL